MRFIYLIVNTKGIVVAVSSLYYTRKAATDAGERALKSKPAGYRCKVKEV